MKETKARNLRGMLTSRVQPGQPDGGRRDLRARRRQAAKPRPSRLTRRPGRAAVPGDPQGQDHGPADRLPVADRRGAAAARARSSGSRPTSSRRSRGRRRSTAATRSRSRSGWPTAATCPADEPVELYRFANRVPLQYQQSACAITKSVLSIDWKKYGLQQSRGALPVGPDAGLRAHRLGLGAVHLRIQGGGRLLSGDRQGDPAGADGGRPPRWGSFVRRAGARPTSTRSAPTSRSTSRTSGTRCRRSWASATRRRDTHGRPTSRRSSSAAARSDRTAPRPSASRRRGLIPFPQ